MILAKMIPQNLFFSLKRVPKNGKSHTTTPTTNGSFPPAVVPTKSLPKSQYDITRKSGKHPKQLQASSYQKNHLHRGGSKGVPHLTPPVCTAVSAFDFVGQQICKLMRPPQGVWVFNVESAVEKSNQLLEKYKIGFTIREYS